MHGLDDETMKIHKECVKICKNAWNVVVWDNLCEEKFIYFTNKSCTFQSQSLVYQSSLQQKEKYVNNTSKSSGHPNLLHRSVQLVHIVPELLLKSLTSAVQWTSRIIFFNQSLCFFWHPAWLMNNLFDLYSNVINIHLSSSVLSSQLSIGVSDLPIHPSPLFIVISPVLYYSVDTTSLLK